MLGTASMRGVPPFGLPKISSFVGGISIPTFAASPLWSMIANRVISLDRRIFLSLSTVSSTEGLLGILTMPPHFPTIFCADDADHGRMRPTSSAANSKYFTTSLLSLRPSFYSVQGAADG